MTTDDALRILGLSPGATREQAEAAFLSRIKMAHSDTGGSDDEARQLIEARDALTAPKQSGMIPVDSVRDLLAIVREERRDQQREREQERKYDESRAESKRVSNNIVITHTRRYRELRRRAAFLGSFAFGITILQADLLPKFGEVTPDSPVLRSALICLWVYSVIRIWLYTTLADDLKESVDDLTERLSERSFYLRMLADTSRYTSDPPWSELEWHQGISRWVQANRRTVRAMGRRRSLGAYWFSEVVIQHYEPPDNPPTAWAMAVPSHAAHQVRLWPPSNNDA